MGYLDNTGLSYFWGKLKDIFAEKADIPAASSATPQALGMAAAGSSTNFSRADHVHAMPSASDIGAIPSPSSGSTGQVLKKTASGVEWANESGGGATEVFWATYGTTTYSEIGDALTAGKLVMCEYSGIYYSYHYRMMDTRYFTSEGGYEITVTSGNVWSQRQVLPPSAATATPLMDGTAAVGSSSKYAKEDHVHPSDTTKISMPSGGSNGQFLQKTTDGVTWATPSGGGGGSVDYFTISSGMLCIVYEETSS